MQDTSQWPFLRGSYTRQALLKHVGSRDDTITMEDMARGLRAMGLDPSKEQVREAFVKADKNANGRMEYSVSGWEGG